MASSVAELFVLRQTKFTVCTNIYKQSICFFDFFFFLTRKKNINLRHDSKAVCVSHSKFLVLADVESGHVYAS